MTNKQAVRMLLTSLNKNSPDGCIYVNKANENLFLDAICLAICALMREEEGKHCKCQTDA